MSQAHVIVKVKSFSHVRLFATLWTVAHHAPRAVGFSRQEYWSGLPCLFVCPLLWAELCLMPQYS